MPRIRIEHCTDSSVHILEQLLARCMLGVIRIPARLKFRLGSNVALRSPSSVIQIAHILNPSNRGGTYP
jgi:hypothetical protein